jgi:hypothetical protein
MCFLFSTPRGHVFGYHPWELKTGNTIANTMKRHIFKGIYPCPAKHDPKKRSPSPIARSLKMNAVIGFAIGCFLFSTPRGDHRKQDPWELKTGNTF